MSESFEGFWPDDLPLPGIRTPIAVLRQAAGELAQISKGMFEAEVESDEIEELDQAIHRMILIAPGLGRYSRSILEIQHHLDLAYPCLVIDLYEGSDPYNCATEQVLVRTIRKLLASEGVRSMMYSLVAKMSTTAE